MRLEMNIDCVQKNGKESLWPIFDAWEILDEWLDVSQIDAIYHKLVVKGNREMRSIRKLQSV